MTGSEPPDLAEHEKRYSWVSDLVESLGWHELVRYRVAVPEHINMKELRAYRTRLRHAARRAECHGTRRLTLLDSSVVRGTASKGRSSSRRLNRIWKPVVPELLAADIQAGTLPVPTKHMPADGATRRSRTRPVPTRSPPAWLEALEASDYTLFDDVYAASTRRIQSVFFFRRSRWRTRNALRSQSRSTADRRGCDLRQILGVVECKLALFSNFSRNVFVFRYEFVFSLRSDRDPSHFAS